MSTDTLKILVINGGVGLVLALALIKVIGSVFEKVGANMVQAITELRNDVRTASAAQNLAITANTDRVSRIEGRVLGLVSALAPQLDDPDEVTGSTAIPESMSEHEATPVEVPPSVHRKRAAFLRTTPATGLTALGQYHVNLKKQR